MVGNIFLVGMMGAGKTTIGQALAKRLTRPFFDTDQEIVRHTGVAIPVIFDIEGEAGFRQREHAILQELTQMNDVVLATGGGVVLQNENCDILKSRGTVIYLRASADDLWRRTRHDRNRPLLHTPNPLETLRALHEQRDPRYREVADIIVDTGSQSAQRLVIDVVNKLAAFSAGKL